MQSIRAAEFSTSFVFIANGRKTEWDADFQHEIKDEMGSLQLWKD